MRERSGRIGEVYQGDRSNEFDDACKRSVETLDLTLRELIFGIVGDRKVAVHPSKSNCRRPFGNRCSERARGMRVGSDPLHASVNLHMNRQARRACSNECVKERPRVDGGSEAVLDNFARTLGRLLAKNENRTIDAGPTKRYTLTD